MVTMLGLAKTVQIVHLLGLTLLEIEVQVLVEMEVQVLLEMLRYTDFTSIDQECKKQVYII